METFLEDIVNQYVLHKQHLLDESKAKEVLQVINDIIACMHKAIGRLMADKEVSMEMERD